VIGIANFTNNSYFTRRATDYPEPGKIPSDARTFYTTLSLYLIFWLYSKTKE
jgi:hypothetical protein